MAVIFEFLDVVYQFRSLFSLKMGQKTNGAPRDGFSPKEDSFQKFVHSTKVSLLTKKYNTKRLPFSFWMFVRRACLCSFLQDVSYKKNEYTPLVSSQKTCYIS